MAARAEQDAQKQQEAIKQIIESMQSRPRTDNMLTYDAAARSGVNPANQVSRKPPLRATPEMMQREQDEKIDRIARSLLSHFEERDPGFVARSSKRGAGDEYVMGLPRFYGMSGVDDMEGVAGSMGRMGYNMTPLYNFELSGRNELGQVRALSKRNDDFLKAFNTVGEGRGFVRETPKEAARKAKKSSGKSGFED